MKLNRSMHKSCFMTFCYNQEHWGRIKELRKKFLNITDEEYEDLRKFSEKYEEFLEEIFPKLIFQKNLLNDIVKEVISSYGGSLLKTLDGSVLKWWIYKTIQEVKKVRDPLSETKKGETIKYLTFRVNNIVDAIDIKNIY